MYRLLETIERMDQAISYSIYWEGTNDKFSHLYWEIQRQGHIFKNQMFLRLKYESASMFFRNILFNQLYLQSEASIYSIAGPQS